MQYKKDAAGNTVLTRFAADALQQIAQTSNGVFIYYQNTEQTLSALKHELSQIEKKTFVDVSYLNYNTYYMWFALPMLLILLLETFLPDKKKRTSF